MPARPVITAIIARPGKDRQPICAASIDLTQLGVYLCPLQGHIAPSLQSDRFDRSTEDKHRAAIAAISLFTVNRSRGHLTA